MGTPSKALKDEINGCLGMIILYGFVIGVIFAGIVAAIVYALVAH